MPMIAIISASDQGHQSNLPVRMGIYVGEEGVDSSFIVGKVEKKGYRGDSNGVGERRLFCGMLCGCVLVLLLLVGRLTYVEEKGNACVSYKGQFSLF